MTGKFPTTPGFYWFHLPGDKPEVVEVDFDGAGGYYIRTGVAMITSFEEVEFASPMWSIEPLIPPK